MDQEDRIMKLAAHVVYWWDVAVSENLASSEMKQLTEAIDELREYIQYRGEYGNS